MKKLFTLFAFLVLSLSPTVASAQAWQHSDWTDGSIPARDWTTASSKPTGAAPADAFEPADVSDSGFTESAWIVTTNGTTDYVQTSGAERKFRITCEPGTAKTLDPILYYAQGPPVGHHHQGIGNVGWNENSTWTTLRASPSATCSGGPLNGTIYWEPAMMTTLPGGMAVSLRPQVVTFYYIEGTNLQSMTATWLRRDFAFIAGANVGTTGASNDYNDTARRAEYAAQGWEYPGSPDTPAGFQGWQCYTDAGATNLVTVTRAASRMRQPWGDEITNYARHIVAEDGSDPWGGNCTGTTSSPGTLMLNLIAPGCWDRHNLRSPDGRGHVAFAARKPDNSITGACPKVVVNGVTQEYGKVPVLTTKTEWRHAGWDDYKNWWMASDRMNSPGTPADASSKDPCRAISAYFCPGSTAHFDWMNGWKSSIIDEWQRECLGITVRSVAPTNGPAECDTSQISKFRKLAYGGASPDANMSGGCTTLLSCSNAIPSSVERYNPLLPGTQGDFTVRHDHGSLMLNGDPDSPATMLYENRQWELAG